MSWQWWRWRTSFHSSLRRTPLGFSDPIGEGDSRAWGPRQCTISLTHRHRTFFNNFSMEEWFTLPHTCFAHGTDLTSASHGKHRSPRQQPEVGVFLNRPHYYNKTTTDFFFRTVSHSCPRDGFRSSFHCRIPRSSFMARHDSDARETLRREQTGDSHGRTTQESGSMVATSCSAYFRQTIDFEVSFLRPGPISGPLGRFGGIAAKNHFADITRKLPVVGNSRSAGRKTPCIFVGCTLGWAPFDFTQRPATKYNV